jgi:hypothetical protein
VDDPLTDTRTQLKRLKLHLYIIFWEWARRHAAKLASGAAGLVVGGITAYIAIWTQLHEARSAATDAKSATDRLQVSISNFATRDQVNALKERVDDLWVWREQVYDKADLSPHANARRRQ